MIEKIKESLNELEPKNCKVLAFRFPFLLKTSRDEEIRSIVQKKNKFHIILQKNICVNKGILVPADPVFEPNRNKYN